MRPSRVLGAAVAIIGLALARARRRRSSAALVALSVAGSIVVLGSLLGVGIVTEDLATRRALSDLAPPDRLIGLRKPSENVTGEADADRFARQAMQPVLAVTEPIVSVTLYQPPRDPFRVLALDDAQRWAEIRQGRLPAPCAGGTRCEAVRVGAFALPSGVGEIGTHVQMDGMRLDIVGVAVPTPDLPLSVIQPDGLALLVDGLGGIRDTVATKDVRRTTFWLAPIDPDRVHSWTLADLNARVDAMERALAPTGRTYLVTTPEQTLATVRGRTAVAAGRLVFVSSLIVGVLLAFAAFAAAIERRDVLLEDRRLRAAGASRLGRLGFVATEALVPAVVGAIVGEVLAMVAVAILATVEHAPVDVVVNLALLQPETLRLTATLALLGAVAVALGIHPSAARLLEPRLVIAGAVPAVAILLWSRVNAGPADPQKLAAEATSPGAVLLPGLLGLSVILGALILVPPVLRFIARHAGRAPLSLRLASVSVAREPLRPAAVMTLLAFSIGAVVFGQTYAATLRQGAADQAAFRTGLDVRVQTLAAEGRFATEAIPLLRQGAAGTDVEVHPMVRTTGETATRHTFDIAGIEAPVIASLDGWRRDFSPSTPAALAAAIAMPGEWTLTTQPIPDGQRTLDIAVDATGDPVHLVAVVQEAAGPVRHIELGDLAKGRQVLHGALLDDQEAKDLPATEPRGWRVVALLASNGGDTGGGQANQGHPQHAEVRLHGLDALFDPAASIAIDVSGDTGSQLLRPRARTDGLVLPAIVSPELAGDVDPQGLLSVGVGSSLRLELKPVGTTTRFPTLVDAQRVVIVDLAPLLLAMNAHDPGTGVPNQVLLHTPSDARTAEVVDALSRDPFPPLIVQSRPAIEAERAEDPFAIGIVWGLAVGAIAGLLLSIAGVLMATATELRDERGELWDLEAQGATPGSLARLVVLRTIALCALGTGVGIGLGAGLGWFAAWTIGVGGEGTAAQPPLVLVIPWPIVAAVSAALLALLSVAVLALTRRHFAQPSLGEAIR